MLILSAISELTAMYEADFAGKWQACTALAQLSGKPCSAAQPAEPYIAFLRAFAKCEEARMLGTVSSQSPKTPGCPSAAEYHAALLAAAESLQNSLSQLSRSCRTPKAAPAVAPLRVDLANFHAEAFFSTSPWGLLQTLPEHCAVSVLVSGQASMG